MARISLYLDEHIQLALAEALRARGVDVLTTQEAGNVGLGIWVSLPLQSKVNGPYFHII